MLTRRFQILAGFAVFALAAAFAAACDLNPQPLPPGLTANGEEDAGASTAPSGGGQGSDAGIGTLSADDAGVPTSVGSEDGSADSPPHSDAGSADGAAAPELDAGDGGPAQDAGDAASAEDGGELDAGDASTDASKDAL